MKSALTLIILTAAMLNQSASAGDSQVPTRYKDDVSFLKKHVGVVELIDRRGETRVACVPAYQGRIMTSTAGGQNGLSYGWVNRDAVASTKVNSRINVYGGEDRFWMGPEGGQFSIFFAPEVPFDTANWYTPAPLDTEHYDIVAQGRDHVTFRKMIKLANYSGTKFDVEVNREVRLIGQADAWKQLGVEPVKNVKVVAFESDNRVTNKGAEPWTKATGLLSVWILGMFNASPSTTVVVPFNPGAESELGPVVNDAYFGKVPADRLVVKDNVLFFKGDAGYRSKIGLSPKRAKPILGSYDAAHGVLTIVQFTLPAGATDYVNSMWKIQDDPFAGDVVNSYNDGPSTLGKNGLGPFYELETSSPAAALKPGETLAHVHRTIHLQGSELQLDGIAQATLGVGLKEISNAFNK